MTEYRRKRFSSVSIPLDCWGVVLEKNPIYPIYRSMILSVPGFYHHLKSHGSGKIGVTRDLVFTFVDLPPEGVELGFVRRVKFPNPRRSRREKQISTRLKDLSFGELLFCRLLQSFPLLESIKVFPYVRNLRTVEKLTRNYETVCHKFLRKIVFCEFPRCFIRLNADIFPSLESFHIIMCSFCKETDPLWIDPKIKLKEFVVDSVSVISGNLELDSIINNNKSSLIKLKVEGNLEEISHLENLEVLKINSENSVSHLPSLRSFHILNFVSWEESEGKVDWETIGSKLETLVIHEAIDFRKIKEIFMEKCLEKLRTFQIQIQSLEGSYSDPDIEHTVSFDGSFFPPNLETLRIRLKYGYSFKEGYGEWISYSFSEDSLKNLKNIDLTFNYGERKEEFISFERCKNTLEKLTLRYVFSYQDLGDDCDIMDFGEDELDDEELEMFEKEKGTHPVLILNKFSRLKKVKLVGYAVKMIELNDCELLKCLKIKRDPYSDNQDDVSKFGDYSRTKAIRLRNLPSLSFLQLEGMSSSKMEVIGNFGLPDLRVLKLIRYKPQDSDLPVTTVFTSLSGFQWRRIEELVIDETITFPVDVLTIKKLGGLKFLTIRNVEKHKKCDYVIRSLFGPLGSSLRLLTLCFCRFYETPFKDGLLSVDMKRRITEILKLKKIEEECRGKEPSNVCEVLLEFGCGYSEICWKSLKMRELFEFCCNYDE